VAYFIKISNRGDSDKLFYGNVFTSYELKDDKSRSITYESAESCTTIVLKSISSSLKRILKTYI
jgi:hypothetical protein